jgi:AraC-like DNA-binding protein
MENGRGQQQNVRRKLVAGKTLLAEEIIARPELPPKGISSSRQLAITCAGAFDFQVGRSISWIDTTRLLFVEAGQDFVDHHVVPGVGHRSVILTPGTDVLDELSSDHDAPFGDRVRFCSLKVQMLAQLLRRATDPMAAEEIGIAVLAEGIGEDRRVTVHDPRCVRDAKARLHDCNEGRLTLSEVAEDIGVTSIHLTQAFKRSEGMPLYRYQTHLRLGRALAELPEREDITDLALELGYSSHSHFTATFRAALGVTPSAYRDRAQS